MSRPILVRARQRGASRAISNLEVGAKKPIIADNVLQSPRGRAAHLEAHVKYLDLGTEQTGLASIGAVAPSGSKPRATAP